VKLFESLKESRVSLGQQGVLISEDSCGFTDHVNEYDDNFKICTIQKEDQKSIMMIGGIRVFLLDSPIEARECVMDVATEERQPTETIMEEEMEQTLMFTQGEKEEHSKEWLKNFSQEDETEITAVLEATEEEEEMDSMEFVGLCEELEALDRRVMVQNLHIQQAKLEESSGAYQP
jgi:hypothetical protein